MKQTEWWHFVFAFPKEWPKFLTLVIPVFIYRVGFYYLLFGVFFWVSEWVIEWLLIVWERVIERVRQSEVVSEWEGEIDRISKSWRIENNTFPIRWSCIQFPWILISLVPYQFDRHNEISLIFNFWEFKALIFVIKRNFQIILDQLFIPVWWKKPKDEIHCPFCLNTVMHWDGKVGSL